MGCGSGKPSKEDDAGSQLVPRPRHVSEETEPSRLARYTDYKPLLQILDRGPSFGSMKLIRGSWLMNRHNMNRLRRQQELPKEAFWNPDELRCQLSHVSILAISYCWHHPIHPDPRGKTLEVLQRAIQLRLALKGPYQKLDLAIFLDFLSLPQHGEQGDENDPVRGALRSESEEVAFENGLKNVNCLYANQLVETWMIKWTPHEEVRDYTMRGWPFFEHAVSRLMKPVTMLTEIDYALCADSWIDVYDKGKIGREPPLIPSIFKEALSSKTFTSNDDRTFVEVKYEETFKDVFATAKALSFAGLGWKDKEAECFVEVFPFAAHLERLLFGDNKISKVGAEAIIRGSERCPSLQYLDLQGNCINEDESDGLLQLWQSFGKPPIGMCLSTTSELRSL